MTRISPITIRAGAHYVKGSMRNIKRVKIDRYNRAIALNAPARVIATLERSIKLNHKCLWLNALNYRRDIAKSDLYR